MTDTMTPEQRHRCMAAIKGRDTKPEMMVRKFLFSKGLRYRVNNRKLPGTPDIVLKKYRTVIFIDGCFWHGHEGCKYYRLPKTNADFWRQKINLNIARDYANGVYLRLAGWRVIRIWECQIRSNPLREATLRHLYHQLTATSPPYTQPATPHTQPATPAPTTAAEPPAPYATKPRPPHPPKAPGQVE